MIATLTAEGRAVVVATHDVEFVPTSPTARSSWRRARSSPTAPTAEVLGGSPAFATQVAKILGEPWLTVDDVRARRYRRRLR